MTRQTKQFICVETSDGPLKAWPLSAFDGFYISKCGRAFVMAPFCAFELPRFPDIAGQPSVKINGVVIRVSGLIAHAFCPELKRKRAMADYHARAAKRRVKEKAKVQAWATLGLVDDFA